MSYHRESTNLEPNILGYQLIGDSQFLRFSEQLLRKQRKKNNGIAYLGLCVSGQKIGDLLKRVKEHFYPTSKKAILMIGTNDLLQNTCINTMRNNLDLLIDELLTRGVTKLILLTIPPVPRLAKSYDHWQRLTEFNKHIKTRHDGEDIIVINAYTKFVKSNSRSSRSSTSSLNNLDVKRRSSSSIIFPEELLNRTGSPNYKLNLRISIGAKRKVYELSEGEDSFNQSSGSDYSSPSPAKRWSYGMNSDYIEDDHDDRFVEEDSFSQLNIDIIDEIRMDLFEEYFSRSSGRKDLIHFNYDGLKMIRALILNEIEK